MRILTKNMDTNILKLAAGLADGRKHVHAYESDNHAKLYEHKTVLRQWS
jgi:hypothetical protein